MSYKLEIQASFDCQMAIEDAFDYIVDFSNIHEWDHSVLSSRKISDGDLGLGAKFDLVLLMGSREVPLAYEITEFDTPNRAVLTGTNAKFSAVDTVELTRVKDGCRVEWRANLEFTGITALIVRFKAKKIKAGGIQTIRDLEKKLTEENEP